MRRRTDCPGRPHATCFIADLCTAHARAAALPAAPSELEVFGGVSGSCLSLGGLSLGVLEKPPGHGRTCGLVREGVLNVASGLTGLKSLHKAPARLCSVFAGLRQRAAELRMEPNFGEVFLRGGMYMPLRCLTNPRPICSRRELLPPPPV